jgi:hypothetical protein
MKFVSVMVPSLLALVLVAESKKLPNIKSDLKVL